MYTPTRARLLFGCRGFSSRPTTRPVVVQFGDTELARIGHLREHDLRIRPHRAELLHQRGDTADDEVVTEVHHEVVVAKEFPGHEDGMGQAERRRLPDVRGLRPKADPSPTAALIASAVSPTTIPTSVIPASRMASRP